MECYHVIFDTSLDPFTYKGETRGWLRKPQFLKYHKKKTFGKETTEHFNTKTEPRGIRTCALRGALQQLAV